MAVLLTGGAGFVATTLIDRLLSAGEAVISIDNLSRGAIRHLDPWLSRSDFTFLRADLAEFTAYRSAILSVPHKGPITEVWHLAANSDIPAGVRDPDVDLRDTFMTTFNTLKIMDEFAIRHLYFASSSAIYGDLQDQLLTELTGPLFPISNYGAMKLASEAAITAAAERFLTRALIFRFPNVIGIPATHGVIMDFIQRLRNDPSKLVVLGDGTQRKSYLHVSDLVDAMMFLRQHVAARVDAYNIGPGDDGITVREIAEAVVAAVVPAARIEFGADNKGWVGDVPRFRYSIDKLRQIGWTPKLDSVAAVRRAISEIAQQISV